MAKPSKPRGPHQTLIQRSRAIGAEQKARYHQQAGAGKAHVKRRFLGLTTEDKAVIQARVNAYVAVVVRNAR